MQTLWLGVAASELALREVVIVEFLIRQTQIGGSRLLRVFRPSGVFICAATRTSFSSTGNICAAVGTGFRGHDLVARRRLSRARVFLVSRQIQSHQHVVVFDRLHVFDVIIKTQHFAESEHRKHVNRRSLAADKFCFNFF